MGLVEILGVFPLDNGDTIIGTFLSRDQARNAKRYGRGPAYLIVHKLKPGYVKHIRHTSTGPVVDYVKADVIEQPDVYDMAHRCGDPAGLLGPHDRAIRMPPKKRKLKLQERILLILNQPVYKMGFRGKTPEEIARRLNVQGGDKVDAAMVNAAMSGMNNRCKMFRQWVTDGKPKAMGPWRDRRWRITDQGIKIAFEIISEIEAGKVT